MLEEIDLYLTNRCNLSCDFCSIQARRNMEELSLEKIKSIVDDAKKLGLKELHLTGGEPTLRDDLEDIVSYVVKSGLNTRLITNGTILSKERLEKLYELGLRNIMISIDGDAEYHNKERGEYAFERAIQTINNAIQLNMFVRVNSVAWRDNANCILEMPKYLSDLGVKVYSIFLGSPLGYAQARKDKVITPYCWKAFCDKLRDKVKDISMKVVVEKGFYFFEHDWYDINSLSGRGRGCNDIAKYEDFFLIKNNGDMYPCVFFSNEAPPIGNIYDNSLEEIVNKFREHEFYREIGNIQSECSDCNKSYLCKGGCRGYSKLINGCWNTKDSRCEDGLNKTYIPLCPIVKINLTDNIIGGSSEQVI